jgi:hypothetical protein
MLVCFKALAIAANEQRHTPNNGDSSIPQSWAMFARKRFSVSARRCEAAVARGIATATASIVNVGVRAARIAEKKPELAVSESGSVVVECYD